jgi:hypothetical protein
MLSLSGLSVERSRGHSRERVRDAGPIVLPVPQANRGSNGGMSAWFRTSFG